MSGPGCPCERDVTHVRQRCQGCPALVASGAASEVDSKHQANRLPNEENAAISRVLMGGAK